MDETALRHNVRREIVRNSGDTTWITDAVVRAYTAGQTADMSGSIDAFHRMSKATETMSLADRLHECAVPVLLLVGTVPHPAEVTADQQATMRSSSETSAPIASRARASTSRRSSPPWCWRQWLGSTWPRARR